MSVRSLLTVSSRSVVQIPNINLDNVLDSEQLLISQVIDRREIRWLCHFTSRQNLENIRKFGLVSRDLLPENTVITDSFRYDQHPNAICLSISKPNSWMFKKKQEQGLDLCLLLIDPIVLYKKQCLFYAHNAATACYRNVDPCHFTGEVALEKLFNEIITYQKSGCNPQHIARDWNKRDCETTSDQAEVQCLENIEPNYILHIFENSIPLTYDDILSLYNIELKSIEAKENYIRSRLKFESEITAEQEYSIERKLAELKEKYLDDQSATKLVKKPIRISGCDREQQLKLVKQRLEELRESYKEPTTGQDKKIEVKDSSSGYISECDYCWYLVIFIILIYLFIF